MAGILRKVARGLCGSEAEADDLVQDTFERAMRKADRFDGGNARGWLVAVMRNLFFDRCRREARLPPHAPLAETQSAAPEADPGPFWAQLTVEDVREAAQLLSPKLRSVYELRAFEGKRYHEIADALDIPIDTVSSRLGRARRQLRDLLSARIGGEEPTP